eukprot:CAMPEP_0170740582 /NCGR_PEP_ID=MMETSP0437-20130122/5760_1 /TAXON_ID=0 /ORGANISM="Sexangularia sp." /LENGTH=238 /DNA_ID=CAMNT_0011079091 /DNA_START=63 /DNA_END=779 /DNA_ORIENTATION=-
MARNPFISKGIRKYAKGSVYGAKAAHIKEQPKKVEKAPTVVTKPFQGGERKVSVRKSRHPLARRVKNPNKAEVQHPKPVRSSIKPGTVLILLAGRHRGKRVVALKTLKSGLIVISGPQSVNKVPLRRVNQAYVIATKTRVEFQKATKEAVHKIDDAYFADLKKQGEKAAKQAKAEASGDKKAAAKVAANKAIAAARKKDQVAIDEAIAADLKGKKDLLAYLGCRFSLEKGQYPHKMTF